MITNLERLDSNDLAVRIAIEGALTRFWTAIPAIAQATSDGHTMSAQASINGIQRQFDGSIQNLPLPPFNDVPVHFTGGGGVTSTHPVASGDEGLMVFASRNQDSWHQSGGTNNDPIDGRTAHLSDGRWIPGGRSDPRKLANVNTTEIHQRTDDAKHTSAVGPTGITHKSVPASDSATDPYGAATTFYASFVQAASGIAHQAVSPGVMHQITNDLTAGPRMRASNDAHIIQNHPTNGPLLTSSSGSNAMSAAINPSSGFNLSATFGAAVHTMLMGTGGISLNSSVAIGFSAPSMSFPSASIGGAALQTNSVNGTVLINGTVAAAALTNGFTGSGAFVRATGASMGVMSLGGSGSTNVISLTGYSGALGNDGILMIPFAVPATPIAFENAVGGVVGSITTNGSATAYNLSSDERLKKIHGPHDPREGLARVLRIKLYEGEFHEEPGEVHTLLLAHELQEINPRAVTGKRGAMRMTRPVLDDEGNEIEPSREVIAPQQVDYSKIVPDLIAANQALAAEIAELRTMLEGRPA